MFRPEVAALTHWRVSVDGPRFVFYFLATGTCAVLAQALGIPGVPLIHAEGFALAPFMRTRVGAALAIVSILAAAARVAQGIFGFDQVFVSAGLFVRNFSGFPVFVEVGAVAAIALVVFLLVAIFRMLPKRQMLLHWGWFAALACALVGMRSLEEATRTNIVGTSYGYLAGQLRFADMYSDSYETPGPRANPYPGTRGAELAAKLGANYWLIVVESMGDPSQPWVKDEMLRPLRESGLTARYDVLVGSTPSVGSTIHGEIRELCNGRLVDGLMGRLNEHCVPNYLRARGYRTMAVHANKSSVYGRNLWYPSIGFSRVLASDTEAALNGENSDRWGTMLDEQTVHWTASTQLSQSRAFAYLLTVSTHLPATLLPGATPLVECRRHDSELPEQVCTHLANVRSVIGNIAHEAMGMSNTVVTIVGDHPPPFVVPRARSAFSNTNVPYIILVPKQNHDH